MFCQLSSKPAPLCSYNDFPAKHQLLWMFPQIPSPRQAHLMQRWLQALPVEGTPQKSRAP